MSLQASSNCIPALFNYVVSSDIDPLTFIDLAGKSVVRLGFYLSNVSSSSIAGAKVEFFGSQTVGGAALDLPVNISDVAGDATASGNTLTFTNSLPRNTVTVTIVDPPTELQVAFSATTFPGSFNGSSIQCSVSWR